MPSTYCAACGLRPLACQSGGNRRTERAQQSDLGGAFPDADGHDGEDADATDEQGRNAFDKLMRGTVDVNDLRAMDNALRQGKESFLLQ